ncbi:MAG: DUF4440 domain-containing protein [Casimicrobium sp.]
MSLTEQHLIDLEKSLHDPKVRADRSQLDRLIADDFVETGATGVTFGKAPVMTRLPQEQGISFNGENFVARMLAPTIGLVTYESAKKTEDSVRRSKRSSIWALREGQWQMVYHQGTLVSLETIK